MIPVRHAGWGPISGGLTETQCKQQCIVYLCLGLTLLNPGLFILDFLAQIQISQINLFVFFERLLTLTFSLNILMASLMSSPFSFPSMIGGSTQNLQIKSLLARQYKQIKHLRTGPA